MVPKEVSQLVAQYEAATEAKEDTEHTSYHGQTYQAQQVFLENVELALLGYYTDMSNPFQDDDLDLNSLDMKDTAHPSALISMHYERGKVRFQEKRLEREESTFSEQFQKSRIDFF